MENASKALIIAGAILLSILLISLSIMIYTQAQEVVNGESMNEFQIASFNSKFQKYEGTNIKGAQVKSLINEMIAVNNDDNEENDIEPNFTAATPAITKKENINTSWVNSTTTYTVNLIYDSEGNKSGSGSGTSTNTKKATGRVTKIEIKKSSNP